MAKVSKSSKYCDLKKKVIVGIHKPGYHFCSHKNRNLNGSPKNWYECKSLCSSTHKLLKVNLYTLKILYTRPVKF